MTLRRYKLVRRIMLLAAALPLCQVSQCETGIRQVLASVANQLPSTLFSILQSAALAPFFALVSGGGGGTTGGGGGI